MEVNFDESLPEIPSLLGPLNEVILNLIVNASHAIADKAGYTKIRTITDKGRIIASTKNKSNYAEIRIYDSGMGIPEKIQEKIFYPFFTTKEVGKVTGQGLSLSHYIIVKKHGGSLTFDTVPGEGTAFVLQLPKKM